jgi:acetyl-CoA carboxylase biotin carboxyl carrier protein
MKRSELTEFAVEEEGFKLKIRRGSQISPSVALSRDSSAPFVPVEPSSSQLPVSPVPVRGGNVVAASAEESDAIYIKSPMVGTFYRSPSPESKPFAEVGSKVTETSAVCIIEAMKIMNEIQSEVKGTIIEALVENGQPVEYGQKLFKLKSI